MNAGTHRVRIWYGSEMGENPVTCRGLGFPGKARPPGLVGDLGETESVSDGQQVDIPCTRVCSEGETQ